ALKDQLVDPRVEEAVARLRSAQDQGQIPPGANLPLAVEMRYGPVYYRHVLRKPVQDEVTIATLVAQVLRAQGACARARPGAPRHARLRRRGQVPRRPGARWLRRRAAACSPERSAP
ncbi:TetR-like C-terminal domain-containing protein, partial [Streptomyces asiaticus]|uniref:TetR-like C-terminal domain-containing protein n=1 Tax=Streptomyces asiaticus TaxID=114695 RepID=UPI003F67B4E7